MLTNAPLIASNALITSLRMSVIGSSTVIPFLTKLTGLADVVPSTASATLYFVVNSLAIDSQNLFA